MRYFSLFFSLFMTLSSVSAQSSLQYNSNPNLTENSSIADLKSGALLDMRTYPNAHTTMFGPTLYSLILTRADEGVWNTRTATVSHPNSGLKTLDGKSKIDEAVLGKTPYAGKVLTFTIDGQTFELFKIEKGNSTKYSCLNALGGNNYVPPAQPNRVTCPSITGPATIVKGAKDVFAFSGQYDKVLLNNDVRPSSATGISLENKLPGDYTIILTKAGCPDAIHYVTITQPQMPCKKVAITGKSYTWEPDLQVVLTANNGANFHWYRNCDTIMGLCYKETMKFPGVYAFGYSFEQEGRLCYGTDSFRVNSNIRIQSDCEGMTIVGVRQGENDFVSSYAHLYVEHPMKQLSSKKWDRHQKPKKKDNWVVVTDSVTGKEKRKNLCKYEVDTSYIYTDLNVFSCFFSGSAKLPEGKYKAYVSLEPATGSYPNDCTVDKEHKKVTRQYAANFYSINCGVQGNPIYSYNQPRQAQSVVTQQQTYTGGAFYGGYQYRPYYGGLGFPWCWGIYQGNSCVGYSFPTSCQNNYTWNNNHCPVPTTTPAPLPSWNQGGGNGGNGGVDQNWNHEGGNGGGGNNNGGGNGGNGGNGGWNTGGGQ